MMSEIPENTQLRSAVGGVTFNSNVVHKFSTVSRQGRIQGSMEPGDPVSPLGLPHLPLVIRCAGDPLLDLPLLTDKGIRVKIRIKDGTHFQKREKYIFLPFCAAIGVFTPAKRRQRTAANCRIGRHS